MSSGPSTPELLGRVLELERRQGFRNNAAAGGLRHLFQTRLEREKRETDVLGVQLLRELQEYEEATEGERRERWRGLLVFADAARWPDADEGGTRDASRSSVRPSGAPSGEAVGGGANEMDVREGDGLADAPVRPTAAKNVLSIPEERAESLDQPLEERLKIRTQEKEKIVRLGLRTFRDALYYFPRDHYDCRFPPPLNRLKAGMTTTVVGTLQAVSGRTTAKGQKIVEARVSDATAQLRISWFNQAHIAPLLRRHVGARIAVSGHTDLSDGRLRFVPRDYEFPDDDEATHTARLVPVYGLTEGMTARWMRTFMRRAIRASIHLVGETLPPALRETHDLLPLQDALWHYHFPDEPDLRAAAVRRLAFDELLIIGLGMAQRKADLAQEVGAPPIHVDADRLAAFIQALPFTLTPAQAGALETVLVGLGRSIPMRALLQGDVGSGKTVVAAAALFSVVVNGYQGAMMAPTEILAEQHGRLLTALLEPLGVRVALLTGSVKGARRKEVLDRLARGDVQILVGTHALIQEPVVFSCIALSVVDEQHRFGVEQRALLRGKGEQPHVLAMTATPIPRSLALTLYGDLDVTTIGERPPGRQPIETRWLGGDDAAYRLVREQVASGHQAYIICPLVEESEGEEGERKAAVGEHRRLQKEIFPELRVGLVHGRLKSADKEMALRHFRDGQTDILVATSVIEVGIDVPNATVMVILEANRFGLAQLHQFRGRVGRGSAKSYCLLVASDASETGRARLEALVRTDDGFLLAEKDLELRGPGEFWGTRQSGVPPLRVAKMSDAHLIEEARRAAESILLSDPHLTRPEHAALADGVKQAWHGGVERS